MQHTTVRLFFVAALSSLSGYMVFQRSTATAGIISTFMAAWLIYQFSSKSRAWSGFSNFTNPGIFAINSFFVSFIYLSWSRVPVGKAAYLSIGVFMLGGVLSTLMFKYWNIGG